MGVHGEVRIGISGWRYPPWRTVFYPPKLPQRQELAYAAKIFRSIEINGTFYSLQRPEYFEAWVAETPEDFVFSVKGPRFITHMRRLKDVIVPLANFLASGVLRLGPKFGPILWQFPPNFQFEPKRLESFLKILPHDTESAAKLGRRHDKRLNGRAALKPDTNRPVRHAMEIRHPSFVTPEFINLLRNYNVALVCADSVEWPRLLDLTADFVYCRLHGSAHLYASGYDDQAIEQWAGLVSSWAAGNEPSEPANAEKIINSANPERQTRDVFLYFDNDVKVRAPFDAQRLMARVHEDLTGRD
jgi:uncharacterized protein YecE (DUF72 family)